MPETYDPETFPHRDLTEKIIGAFFDVYRELGFGFQESVYHNALMFALADLGLAAEKETRLQVRFRGRLVGEFDVDIFVERKLILELKAVDTFCAAHEAQLLNYLKATDIEVGLLLNFGPKPRIKRLGFANARKCSRPPVVLD